MRLILDWSIVNHFGAGFVDEIGSCSGLFGGLEGEGKEGATSVLATEQKLRHLIRTTLKARLNDVVSNLHDGAVCVRGSEQ